MRTKLSFRHLILVGIIFISIIAAMIWFKKDDVPYTKESDRDVASSKKSSTQSSEAKSSVKQSSQLPQVSPDDWQLILVNRKNITPELNPELTTVGNITVDSRIAQQVSDFLAAAQTIDPAFHLISGYRSVEYQKSLFQSYVDQEMASDPSLTQEEAETLVKTYSQPAGASEHQTGLAVDLSTVDALNQADPATMMQVQEMAPDYGFVLRFLDGKTDETGVGYEDWHFRYVGKASARYMTDHKLTLEEYIKRLEER
ncbi:M15 family metallopeptidase [Streptococcus pluranimalium]